MPANKADARRFEQTYPDTTVREDGLKINYNGVELDTSNSYAAWEESRRTYQREFENPS